MSQKKTPKDTDYVDDIKIESLENMLAVGRILPRLEPRLNSTYKATILSDDKELKFFIHKTFGKSYTLDIMYDDMKRSVIVPKSFYIQLLAEMIREKLTTMEAIKTKSIDFSVLKGHEITFQKVKGNTKTMENVQLYVVQLD